MELHYLLGRGFGNLIPPSRVELEIQKVNHDAGIINKYGFVQGC